METVETGVKERIFAYIDAIADSLGVAAEHVYGIMVRQQYAISIVLFIVSAIALITLIVGIIGMVRTKDDARFAFTALSILSFAGLVMALINGLLRYLNPEYYAIREIINAVAGG
jgi:hypothetical protein